MKSKDLIKKLHILDKWSYNFRYPVNTKGKYNFAFNTKINLSGIISLYYEIQPFKLYTQDVLNDFCEVHKRNCSTK